MEAKSLINQYKAQLSELVYRNHPAVSQSSLKHIGRSPAHYLENLMNPPEPTKDMLFGTYAHAAILEPERFDKEFVRAIEYGDLRTKEGKVRRDEFLAYNEGKTVLSADEFDVIINMQQTLLAHPQASRLLASGKAEECYFWNDDGVDLKCRPDFLRDGRIIVDVKTTRDASFKSFQRSIANFSYHYQAAMYCDGVSAVTGDRYDTFVIIAIERVAPFGVAVYALDEATIELGRVRYKRDLDVLRKCLETNNWPCYSSDIVSMNAPSWAFEIGAEYE